MRYIQITLFFILSTLYSFFASAEKAVIIIGPPGAGKGTQTVLLRDTLKWPLIAPSTIVREDRLNDGSIANALDSLVSSRIVRDIIKLGAIEMRLAEYRLKNFPRPGIILDGWPKHSTGFPLAREAIFKDDVPLIIELVVDENTLVNRGVQRMVCPNSYCGQSFGLGALANIDGTCSHCGTKLFQRKGDNAINFPLRIQKYFERRNSVVKAYKKFGYPVYRIDGNRNKEEVHCDIMELVRNYIDN